jgi:hypothetical protein
MEETMFRKFLSTTITVLLFAMVTLAQSGKISGSIVDKETNQPLIGANVLVVGTSLGAATDVNGEYSISNVPPGTYSLKASYLGYQDVTIEDIRVVAGLTQFENFKLPTKSLQTEEVVIVSQRPLIQKSATNAIRVVSSEDLESLPVRSINALIGLQAGVVQQNGVTYVRGSRGDETGYMLEGVDTKNLVSNNGGNLVTTIPDAVNEILIQAGGFGAEYGNANAGMISQDFKTGTDKYHFSVRAETDNFGNYPADKFLGTYSYGYSDYTVTLSGPLFMNNLRFFIAGENYFVRDYTPMYFSGNPVAYSDGALFDTTRAYSSTGGTTDPQIITWQAGNIPGRMQNSYNLNGTLLLDQKPLIVRLAGTFQRQLTRTNNPDIRNNFDLERLPYQKYSNLFLSLKGTYLISSNSYFELTGSLIDRRTYNYDQLFGDNVLAYGDSLANAQAGFPQFLTYTQGPTGYTFYGFPFSRPGAPLTGFGKSHWNNFEISGAFTQQFEKHEIKAGASFSTWTLRSYGVGLFGQGGIATVLNDMINNPDFARNNQALSYYFQSNNFRTFAGNYGYDLFGNETDNGTFQPVKPKFASAYLQDRIEINDIIINAGLRYDYINMDSKKFADPADPTFNTVTKLVTFEPGNTFSYVSPKLGFSFPVTDKTVFHMQYGKYVQAPALTNSVFGALYSAQIFIGGNAFITATAYNPEPIRTTQYEIGFSQQFTDFAAFDITAFYKDIKGQLQYAFQNTVAGYSVANYPIYVNQDFATTKGLEMSLKLRRINRVRAEINYTYTDAQGTGSGVGSAEGSVQVNNNVPTVVQPLDYDQTHRGTIMLDYRFGKDDGGPILQQLGANILFTFNSGHPYTLAQPTGLGQSAAWTGPIIGTDYRQRKPDGPVNSATTPWFYEVNLRIDKTVDISDFEVNFYVYVQNLLNTQNVINVYDQTGNAYNDGFLASSDAAGLITPGNQIYGPRFADLYQALNLTNRENVFAAKGIDFFSAPRQLRAGIMLNF